MPRKNQRNTRARIARKPASQALAAIKAARANAADAFGTLIQRSQEARQAVLAGAAQARVKTADAVSRFERVFENRVTGVISRLGVPTARDVRALSRQVAHLQQSVDQLRRVRAR